MKKLHIALLSAFTLLLFSCSSSYRSMQTTDDVYYSPDQNTNGYVGVQSSGDQGYYQNNAPLGMYPSLGFLGSPYGSFLNFNLTFGNPYYSSLFSPIYNPFNSFYGLGYGYMSPYNFGYGFNSFYNPFMSYGYYPYSPGYLYSPYGYGFYNHGMYTGSNLMGWGVVKNNGPRITSATNYLGTGLTNGRGNVLRPSTAPVRTFSTLNNSGIIERNIPAPSLNNVRGNTRAERRAIRKFNSASENNVNRRGNIFTPSERRTEPVREFNNSPVRTFERSSSAPERVIQSAPPVRSTSSGPVRKF